MRVDDAEMHAQVNRLRAVLYATHWQVCRQPQGTVWWVFGDGDTAELRWHEGCWESDSRQIQGLMRSFGREVA